MCTILAFVYKFLSGYQLPELSTSTSDSVHSCKRVFTIKEQTKQRRCLCIPSYRPAPRMAMYRRKYTRGKRLISAENRDIFLHGS